MTTTKHMPRFSKVLISSSRSW